MKYFVHAVEIDEDEEVVRETPDIYLDGAPVVTPVGCEISIQTDETCFYGIVKSVQVTHQMQTIPPICRIEYVCTESLM